MKFPLHVALFAAASVVPLHGQTKPITEPEGRTLIQSYLDAEHAFDAARLSTLVGRNYVEVSPLGEVDEHDRFLGFYAADKKVPIPPMTLTQDHFSTFNDGASALYVGKIAWSMAGPDGVTRNLEMRVTWIMSREDGTVKMQFADYTPIRAKKS